MIRDVTSSVISEAVALLQEGKLVAFPTETVYGLGADARNEVAIAEVFRVKDRPATDPLIVHVANAEAALPYIDLSDAKIAARFKKLSKLWPGPLSIIVPVGKGIVPAVTAGLNKVAIRVPSHPVARELLTAAEIPIAAPSANQFSYVSPTKAEHVEFSLGSKIPLIIDGGSATIGLESTVIDITNEAPYLLRPGAITLSALKEALGEEVVFLVKTFSPSEKLSSPGLLEKHYSPLTKLSLMKNYRPEITSAKIGLIRFSTDTELPSCPIETVVTLSHDSNLEEIGAKLYEAIRELDQLGLDSILIDSCSDEGLGQAIMDRVNRAVHK